MSAQLSPLFTWRSAIADPGSGLRPSARHVALTISLHMSERGDSCFPAIATTAAETGLSKQGVINALRALEAGGWLVLERRGGGRGHPNRYRAVIPERVNVVDRSVKHRTEERVNGSPLKGQPSRPEDVLLEDVPQRRGAKDAPAPSSNGNGNTAAAFVALFVEEYRKRGTEPPKSWLGRVGKACREMLGEETDPDVLTEAVKRAARENRPGSIVYKVADIELERAGGRRAR